MLGAALSVPIKQFVIVLQFATSTIFKFVLLLLLFVFVCLVCCYCCVVVCLFVHSVFVCCCVKFKNSRACDVLRRVCACGVCLFD